MLESNLTAEYNFSCQGLDNSFFKKSQLVLENTKNNIKLLGCKRKGGHSGLGSRSVDIKNMTVLLF